MDINNARYAGLNINPLDESYSVEEVNSALIVKGFSNAEEIRSEKHIRKYMGEDEKLPLIKGQTMAEDFKGVIFADKLDEAQKEVDDMIQKGQESHLTEEEYEALENTQNQINKLEKAIGDFGGGKRRIVYLMPKNTDENPED